jgi:hypothetical protein
LSKLDRNLLSNHLRLLNELLNWDLGDEGLSNNSRLNNWLLDNWLSNQVLWDLGLGSDNALLWDQVLASNQILWRHKGSLWGLLNYLRLDLGLYLGLNLGLLR